MQLLSPSPFCPVSDFPSSRPSPSGSQAPPSSLSPTRQWHKRNPWAGPSPGHGSLGPGWVQSSPPSPSVQERGPACDAFPASVPAALLSLSRPSSASCLESSPIQLSQLTPQNSLHFRRWPPLGNPDPRAPRGVSVPRSRGPSRCPFCAHRAPCWNLSTLQGTLLGAPRRCHELCATGIGALRPS